MDRQSRQLAILLVRGGAEYPGILFHGVWLAKYRCLRQFIGQAERFHCGSQVASYMGLVPAEDSSGERQRLGHISKQGNTLLRFLPVEAAQVTVRGDAEWRRKYFHLRCGVEGKLPRWRWRGDWRFVVLPSNVLGFD